MGETDPLLPVEHSEDQGQVSDWSSHLTKEAGNVTRADIDGLRAAGWRDPQIVATVHISNFFTYMDCVASAFGVA
ncbi:MAG: hypothetical protein FJY56_21685 [Betaproteobacteria bacterium]|nr:hypothetical protein [Betaproteobacteria bacterium]